MILKNEFSMLLLNICLVLYRLVVLGFKRPITEDDMFMLNPREQSRNVIPKFERKWKAEVKKVYRSGIRCVHGSSCTLVNWSHEK